MIHRRRLITLLGGAAAAPTLLWPLMAQGEQAATPVLGFLSSRTPEQRQYLLAAIRAGLQEVGYEEGRNVAITYRWANGQMERLPALAADLVAHRVDVVIAGGTPNIAKNHISTIPVVFTTGLDPVAYGLVSNLNRPAGNLTGVTFYSGALLGKQLELLRELRPQTRVYGLLIKPDSPSAGPQVKDAQIAARAIGADIRPLDARNEGDFERIFADLARLDRPALLVSVDPYFDSRTDQLVELAARYAVPTIYTLREFVQAGGLISYGASISDTYRMAGLYAARILKGAKPSELPVQLPTRFELVINVKTAKTLGIDVPVTLLARADEVIE